MPSGADRSLLKVSVKSIFLDFVPGSGGRQSVTVSNQSQITTFPAIIDSTQPYLYLPSTICDRFQSLLGLTYDAEAELYILNSTQKDRISQTLQSIVIQISDTLEGKNVTSFTFPAAAFEAYASWPFFPDPTPMFPIRRGGNTFILGRTFLQEAYVIADFERRNFTVAQATFQDPVPRSNLVPIYNATTAFNLEEPKSKFNRGAIAGIVLGTVIGLLIIAGLAFYLLRRCMAKRAHSVGRKSSTTFDGDTLERRGTVNTVVSGQTAFSEMDGSTTTAAASPRPGHVRQISELSSESELGTRRGNTPATIYEMDDDKNDAAAWQRNADTIQEEEEKREAHRGPIELPA